MSTQSSQNKEKLMLVNLRGSISKMTRDEYIDLCHSLAEENDGQAPAIISFL